MKLTGLFLLGFACTSHSIEIRVDGEGHFRLARDGRVVFAKKAVLDVYEGKLGASNATFLPAISLSTLDRVAVSLDGTVSLGGLPIGRLVLALFDQGAPNGDGLFTMSTRPKLCNPGEEAAGVIRSDVAATSAHTSSSPAVIRDSGSEIGLKTQATVIGDSIKLSDVAEISGGTQREALGGILLGKSPVLTRSLTLSRNEIVRKLRESGFKPENLVIRGVGPVTVTRKAQSIPHARFAEVALTALNMGLPEGVTAGLPSSDPEFLAPDGSVELVASPPSIRAKEGTVVVSVYVDGKPANSRTVRFVLSVPAIGVHANDVVTVLFKRNDLVVEAKGKAKRQAPVGGTVTVVVTLEKNVETEHTGVVVRPGVVEVKL